jgi:hypothetical protein
VYVRALKQRRFYSRRVLFEARIRLVPIVHVCYRFLSIDEKAVVESYLSLAVTQIRYGVSRSLSLGSYCCVVTSTRLVGG